MNIFFVLLGIVFLIPGSLQADPCRPLDKEMGPAYEKWDALYGQFKRYTPKCDDGYFAEYFSDRVVSLLNDWNKAWEGFLLMKKDPAFQAFVLQHIDATIPEKNIKILAQDARERCPKNEQALCKGLANQADRALKEIAAYESSLKESKTQSSCTSTPETTCSSPPTIP